MPPKMTLNNIFQMLTHPEWSLKSMYYGKPNLKIYCLICLRIKYEKVRRIYESNFSGRLNEEKNKAH